MKQADFPFSPSAASNCPSCGSGNTENLGALPSTPQPTFGGVRAERISAGDLFSCRSCDLRFRFPALTQAALNDLYQALPGTVWEMKAIPKCWVTIQKWFSDLKPGARVLDIGCFRGDFLRSLPPHFQKFGIEPSSEARFVAESRGIEIIGQTIDEGIPNGLKFEVISLIDVLEHLTAPQSVLNKLKAHLVPGGRVLIFTGATDSLPWKIFGRHYWYSALLEHVSFFSLKWFKQAATTSGFSIGRVQYLSSEPQSPHRYILQFIRLLLFVGVTKYREWGIPDSVLTKIPGIKKVTSWTHTPWWRASRDHILIELIKD